ELRGVDAGYAMPQFSIHRGKLHGVLLRAVFERLGAARIHTDCRLVDFQDRAGEVFATFNHRQARERIEVTGDALIGADGIHSRVRSQLYPHEGAPVWSGIMLWRGATEWPVYADGRTMVIAGGNAAKFVVYPIHVDPSKPETRLTNWAVMARLGDGTGPAAAARRLEPSGKSRGGVGLRARQVSSQLPRSGEPDQGDQHIL